MKIESADIDPVHALPFDSWTKPVTITITIAASQLHALKQLAVYHGLPGTPPASLASTCFSRGFTILRQEMQFTWKPDGRSTVEALTPETTCATSDA
jgi:hypothetical protein